VSLFVLSPEVEDRYEVEVVTGRSTKRPSTLNDISMLFYLQADHKKKIGHELIFFLLQCSAPAIPSVLLQYYYI
jgi:hypothetical protein